MGSSVVHSFGRKRVIYACRVWSAWQCRGQLQRFHCSVLYQPEFVDAAMSYPTCPYFNKPRFNLPFLFPVNVRFLWSLLEKQPRCSFSTLLAVLVILPTPKRQSVRPRVWVPVRKEGPPQCGDLPATSTSKQAAVLLKGLVCLLLIYPTHPHTHYICTQRFLLDCLCQYAMTEFSGFRS